MTSRFWKRNDIVLHNVTHRAVGHIPGITLAPRDSIFLPQLLEDVRAANELRAARFAIALDTDQYGQSFRGSSFAEPLFGAYGEKL